MTVVFFLLQLLRGIWLNTSFRIPESSKASIDAQYTQFHILLASPVDYQTVNTLPGENLRENLQKKKQIAKSAAKLEWEWEWECILTQVRRH